MVKGRGQERPGRGLDVAGYSSDSSFPVKEETMGDNR
jgi:hypothetical protein